MAKRLLMPKTLRVKDADYAVRVVATIPDDPKGRLVGLCCAETETIYLAKNQSDRDLLKTLIHEILHAVEFEWDIDIRHKQIYALEEPLYRLIADNFGLKR